MSPLTERARNGVVGLSGMPRTVFCQSPPQLLFAWAMSLPPPPPLALWFLFVPPYLSPCFPPPLDPPPDIFISISHAFFESTVGSVAVNVFPKARERKKWPFKKSLVQGFQGARGRGREWSSRRARTRWGRSRCCNGNQPFRRRRSKRF